MNLYMYFSVCSISLIFVKYSHLFHFFICRFKVEKENFISIVILFV